jgi:glycosyltransferase involved in cell wall biosynthesis
MHTSFVIPVYNEAESLAELRAALDAAVEEIGAPCEYVFVDDGSTDGSLDLLRRLQEANPERVKLLSFRRNYGKSAALAAGFQVAQGQFVVTLDSDLQDDPSEVPRMLALLQDGADLVCGWKRKRRDPWTKRLPSRLFNAVTALLSGVRLHDFNTGLKAYRSDVVHSIAVYGELHRFIPVLVAWQGFQVREIAVRHHARRYGAPPRAQVWAVEVWRCPFSARLLRPHHGDVPHPAEQLAALLFRCRGSRLFSGWGCHRWLVPAAVAPG